MSSLEIFDGHRLAKDLVGEGWELAHVIKFVTVQCATFLDDALAVPFVSSIPI